mmetsp:Transcript_64312/g.153378  ORF Transcript_64312/g.153378 Transcript_64312/m.153378 type:complete len:125 (-) Transcript_64312:107-481(-)
MTPRGASPHAVPRVTHTSGRRPRGSATTTTDVQNPSELKFDDTGVVTVEYKNLAGVDTDEQDLDEGQKKCVDMSWPKPTDEKGGSKPMPVGEVCITKQSAKLNLFAVFELGEEIDKKYHKKTED